MEGTTDYTVLIQQILSAINNLGTKLDSIKFDSDIIFLILAIFLVLFVIRGD